MTDDWRPAHDSPITVPDAGVGHDLAEVVKLDHGLDNEEPLAAAVVAAEQLDVGCGADEGGADETSGGGHAATVARTEDAGEGRDPSSRERKVTS